MVKVGLPPKGAHLQVGDYVGRVGIYTKPGVIVEKQEDGNVVIDTTEEMINRYHRHSVTTGLSPDDKERFNSIMDEIMTNEVNSDRINHLQATIDGLKAEPANKKLVVALRNEQAQLIRLSNELPKVYAYDSEKIR